MKANAVNTSYVHVPSPLRFDCKATIFLILCAVVVSLIRFAEGQTISSTQAAGESEANRKTWIALTRSDLTMEERNIALRDWDGNDFHVACLIGDLKSVSRDIERDPQSANRARALYVRRGQDWISDPDGQTVYPLNLAARGGHTKIVKLLIDSGVDVNARPKWGATAIAEAARGGFDDIVKLLLDAGAEIRKPVADNHLPTSLFTCAVQSGSPKVVELLISRGITVSTPEDSERDLSLAAESGNLRLVELVFPLEPRHERREEALFNAVRKGHRLIVRYFLSHDVAITLQRKEAADALQIAVENCNYEIVSDLLASGADPQLRDRRGWTAFDKANWPHANSAMTRLLSGNLK